MSSQPNHGSSSTKVGKMASQEGTIVKSPDAPSGSFPIKDYPRY